MAISAGAIWRGRIGGSNTLCSGVFDPTVSGAGTDYTEQDTAQLALTDLASATPYTTITSATGGFTDAMKGNGIYIASGTGFTFGRYIITAVTNTNTAIVDRACATVAASGGVAKVGGALEQMTSVKSAAPYNAVSGNVVMVRGQGSNDPIDIDYNAPTPNISEGAQLTFIGYNGRPKIGYNGKLWSAGLFTVENFYFVQTSSTNLTSGIVSGASNGSVLYNCVIDQSGFDANLLATCSAIRCTFLNTGSQTVGTRQAIAQDIATGRVFTIDGCLFKDLKFTAILVRSGQITVTNNIIQNCGGNGIEFNVDDYPQTHSLIRNNTIYGGLGHGVSVPSWRYASVYANIFANITGSGKYAVNILSTTAIAMLDESASRLAMNNFYGNTSNCNVTLNASNTTLDPQFANAPVDLTPTNTALRVIGGVGAL